MLKLKRTVKQNDYIKQHLILWSVLLVSVITAIILLTLSVRIIEINDGKSRYTVKNLSGNVENALCQIGLKNGDYNIISTENKNGKINVTVERTFPVTVMIGEKSFVIKTAASTVGDVLKLAGIKKDEFDMVEPSLDTLVTEKTVIDFMDINYVDEECTEVIPYDVKTEFTNALSSGETVTSEGHNGLKVVNYTCKIVNGVQVERQYKSEKVIVQAVKCVKTVGIGGNNSITTGVAVTSSAYADCYSTLTPEYDIPLDENGVPTNYTKHTTVQATAYTYTGFRMSTGVTPQAGYIAVNPNIIPYGTKMYIVSSDGNWVYGYAVAADTGGFALSRPTNVDLFFESYAQCIAFGRRNIEIYFLP